MHNIIMNHNIHGYIRRDLEVAARSRLADNPALALLGPRQCGKSTLARHLLVDFPEAVYIDAELPSDRNKLRDPEAFLRLYRGRLVCIDEVQRIPDLFPVLRSLIDQSGTNGQFLILGSASRDLIRQSSESLAGRIAYLQLTPFSVTEVADQPTRWLQGGFPRSFFASPDASFSWRIDFIRSFLERDIPMLHIGIPPESVGRLLTMCAHHHGQLLNLEKLAGSMGVHAGTIRNYLDLLCGAFMMRRLPPFMANVKKRLVKSPKIYLRDSGILHALLNITTMDDLFAHPIYGDSWEGLVIEHILAMNQDGMDAGFYRTSNGAEMDLVVQVGATRIGIECKASSAPSVSRGFWNAMDDLQLTEAFIVAPVDSSYPYGDRATVCPLVDCLERIRSFTRM
ncbi:MAG TPA: ATP-binding protein [Kiritimatiellia bacterium]|nr:ATP-binding protein [Kiritimatiellia bacterium]HMP34765.1 ATP-binding protein [Kiritimatiellia bacterium]